MDMTGTASLLSHDDDLQLRIKTRSAVPFPYLGIDDFLEPEFAREVARSFPDFRSASQMGTMFSAVNERRKVQVTDATKLGR